MREPHYGCKNMAFSAVKWPFRENATKKLRADKDRWADSYPIWTPCCLILPFGWLFRGRQWPNREKDCRRRTRPTEPRAGPPSREQTKYPETRISPCSLRPRKDDDNISSLELYQTNALAASLLKRLPLEVRQEIYGYVLGRHKNCLVLLPFKIRAIPETNYTGSNVLAASRNQGFLSARGHLIWPRRPALLRTCRQIYTEAVGLLYAGNTFVIKHPEILFHFSKAIPPQRLNSLRSLRLPYEILSRNHQRSGIDERDYSAHATDRSVGKIAEGST
ncbi:MAG: hypothetical protein Q9216_002350 [Gyalolechia sp. 2 TL-2023]